MVFESSGFVWTTWKNGLVRRCHTQDRALSSMTEMRQRLAQIPCAGFARTSIATKRNIVSFDIDAKLVARVFIIRRKVDWLLMRKRV